MHCDASVFVSVTNSYVAWFYILYLYGAQDQDGGPGGERKERSKEYGYIHRVEVLLLYSLYSS